jgi:hypothetical protein
MRRIIMLALAIGPLVGCAPPPNGSASGPAVSGAPARRTTLMERYAACLTATRATTEAQMALTRCRPELEAALARKSVSPRRQSAMVEAIEFDGRVLLGLEDDPTIGASPNRLAWAFCLTVKSVELDDEVSSVAQVAVVVERACRPFAAASGRAELDVAVEAVRQVRTGQW